MTTAVTAPTIDIISEEVYERGGIPHEQLRWLRANDPVYWHADPSDDVPGFWAVTRHSDVVTVSRHADVFSSRQRTSMFFEMTPEDVELYRLMMLFMDPPEHTGQRSYVNRGFTPRMIKKLEGHIRDIAHELVDGLAGREELDFVEEIAAPLPLYVICELLGAPVEDRHKIFDVSNRLIGWDDPDYDSSMDDAPEVAGEVFEYARAIRADRLRNPRDDIATRLLQADAHGGRELTEDEFCMFVLLLLIAGNETTRNGMSGGMLAFFDHPGQWRRLIADRSLLRTAADEIVRWASPVNLFRRTAMRDTSLGGKEIAEGDKVVVFYGSANRDESVFAQPYTFDIARDPNPHIGFGGGGPHFCLGTHLARLEITVLLEVLLDRMPGIVQAGPARRLRSNFINGIKELPVAPHRPGQP